MLRRTKVLIAVALLLAGLAVQTVPFPPVLDPSLVQSTSAHPNPCTGTAPATCAITYSSSVTGGNLLVVGINFGNTLPSTDYSASDNASGCTDTWTQTPSPGTNNSSPNAIGDITVLWSVACGNQASLTVTVSVASGGSHGARLGAYEYSSTTGWPASPVDKSGSSVANTTPAGSSLNTASITPSVTGTLVWSAIAIASAGATSITVSTCTERPTAGGTAGSGWTSDGRADGADIQTGGTSATVCGWSWSSTNSFSDSVIINFKPATASTAKSFPVVY